MGLVAYQVIHLTQPTPKSAASMQPPFVVGNRDCRIYGSLPGEIISTKTGLLTLRATPTLPTIETVIVPVTTRVISLAFNLPQPVASKVIHVLLHEPEVVRVDECLAAKHIGHQPCRK